MKIELTMTEFQKLPLPMIGAAIIDIEFKTYPAPHVIITVEGDKDLTRD